MRFCTVVFASLAVLAAPIFGTPADTPLISVAKQAGNVNKGSFIIKLKDHVSKDTHLGWLSQQPGANVTYDDWQTDLLHGYAGLSIVRSTDSLLNKLFTTNSR